MQNNAGPYLTDFAYNILRTSEGLPRHASPSQAALSYRPKPKVDSSPTPPTSISTSAYGYPPQIGYFSATPPRTRQEPSVYRATTNQKYKPTELIHEDDEDGTFAERPGHSTYYNSRKFLDKVAAGKVQVPRGALGSSKVSKASKKGATKAQKPKALVMIFGLNNVRRAAVGRKADYRIQKHNKRAKWLRGMNGEESKFGWD